MSNRLRISSTVSDLKTREQEKKERNDRRKYLRNYPQWADVDNLHSWMTRHPKYNTLRAGIIPYVNFNGTRYYAMTWKQYKEKGDWAGLREGLESFTQASIREFDEESLRVMRRVVSSIDNSVVIGSDLTCTMLVNIGSFSGQPNGIDDIFRCPHIIRLFFQEVRQWRISRGYTTEIDGVIWTKNLLDNVQNYFTPVARLFENIDKKDVEECLDYDSKYSKSKSNIVYTHESNNITDIKDLHFIDLVNSNILDNDKLSNVVSKYLNNLHTNITNFYNMAIGLNAEIPALTDNIKAELTNFRVAFNDSNRFYASLIKILYPPEQLFIQMPKSLQEYYNEYRVACDKANYTAYSAYITLLPEDTDMSFIYSISLGSGCKHKK